MSEDGFLERWSRRKRAGTDPPPASDAPPAAEADAAPAPEALTEAEIAALPPVDTITAATDLRAFLRRGVPPLLRQAALRRMWRVNPAIRDYLDDARDYAFDWNAPGGAPGGGVLSAERAAKLMARMFPPKSDQEAASVTAPEAASGVVTVPSTATETVVGAPDPAGPATREPAQEPSPPPTPRRRHGGAAPA